uniref:Uncharacterized protein n=1 Tax=Arundo donax TaxID=35708 RepID=A0A0A9FPA4_ARUDO
MLPKEDTVKSSTRQ